MPLLRFIWHWLWFLRIALAVVLSLAVIQRRSRLGFPVFVLYVCWAALEGVILISMNYAPSFTGDDYFIAYTIGEAASAVLRFAVIYEIFQHLVSRYPALCDSATAYFRSATVVLLLFVVSLAWLAPAAGKDRLMSTFFLLQRTVDALLCGLLLFLLAFSRVFSLTWRNFVVGIALGFGVFASVELATSTLRSQIEPIARNKTTDVIALISQGGYLCSVVVWMAYVFMRDERPSKDVKPPPLQDLEGWNRELERLLR